jgi:hypothetical protein
MLPRVASKCQRYPRHVDRTDRDRVKKPGPRGLLFPVTCTSEWTSGTILASAALLGARSIRVARHESIAIG